MTIQQIKYLETISRLGSVRKAADELYMAQSSLSAAIKEVENEYNLKIFERSNKGVVLTHQGEEFLNDLHYISSYHDHIDQKYKNTGRDNMRLCIASHHHICGEGAFLKLIKSMPYKHYRFGYLEGSTSFVLTQVQNQRADIGLIFYTLSAQSMIVQELRKRDLVFNHISYSKLHIYVSKDHCLAKRQSVTTEEIIRYPFIAYDNLDPRSGMFTISYHQRIKNDQNFNVSDRATAYAILRATDAYATGTGHLSADEKNRDIVSVPITDMEDIEICWLVKDKFVLSEIAMQYVESLKKLYYIREDLEL